MQISISGDMIKTLSQLRKILTQTRNTNRLNRSYSKFGIVLFFGALLVYTFKVLAVSCFLYLCLIPLSYFHFKKIKKEKNIAIDKDEGLEDIL